MFDIGWSELLVIGVVALIVVGPKDLPHLFHALGRFTAKAKGMAREFSSAMEDAAKGAGLDEATGSIRDLKSLTSKKALGLDALDRAAERFEKWDPKLPDGRTVAKRDPGIGDPVAQDGVSPASDLDTKADLPAPGAMPAAPAEPVRAFGQSSPTPPRSVAPAPAADADTPRNVRRIHAVRRSDMKDT